MYMYSWIDSRRAYALAPPQYPNSHLVEEKHQPGRQNDSVLRVYETNDSVEEVLAFMEEHMPGFTETKSYWSDGSTYHNEVIDSTVEEFLGSPPSKASLDWPYDTYPHASVRIEPNPDKPTGTIIHVWVGWPIP
jgi:hypothetical protein